MQAAGAFNDRAGYARDHCEGEQLPEARAPSASRPRAEVCVQRLTTALISARGQPLDEQERARAHGTGRLKTKANEQYIDLGLAAKRQGALEFEVVSALGRS